MEITSSIVVKRVTFFVWLVYIVIRVNCDLWFFCFFLLLFFYGAFHFGALRYMVGPDEAQLSTLWTELRLGRSVKTEKSFSQNASLQITKSFPTQGFPGLLDRLRWQHCQQGGFLHRGRLIETPSENTNLWEHSHRELSNKGLFCATFLLKKPIVLNVQFYSALTWNIQGSSELKLVFFLSLLLQLCASSLKAIN